MNNRVLISIFLSSMTIYLVGGAPLESTTGGPRTTNRTTETFGNSSQAVTTTPGQLLPAPRQSFNPPSMPGIGITTTGQPKVNKTFMKIGRNGVVIITGECGPDGCVLEEDVYEDYEPMVQRSIIPPNPAI